MIKCRGVIKEFGQPAQRILHGLDFDVSEGEFLSISGRSGSGKSTLLYIISTLDSPTQGQVFFDDQDIAALSVEDIHKFRNQHVGFVFQFHYLLPELTSLENILLPARNLGVMEQKRKMAEDLLEELNIAKQRDKLPSQMSGGEQQRVAIARALIMQPRYIFADEPTGNLDTQNAAVVMKILKRVNKDLGTTIALVTHEPEFAAQADREIYLIDGKLADRTHDE